MTRRLGAAAASFVFALTGIGTALLGATLPATLHLWKLSDTRGGVLLLASWAGSTTGAFAARKPGRRSAPLGTALSAVALLFLTRRHVFALPLFFYLYGLGLGLAMTAISTLRAREMPAGTADVELNRLNLVWAAGACLAPVLAVHSLHKMSVALLFASMAATLCFGAGLLLFFTGVARVTLAQPGTAAAHAPMPLVPLRFSLFGAAAVGMESAIGSWLATYAERTSTGIAIAVSATAFFWAGLLLSRAAHSIPGASWFHTRPARVLHILAAGAGVALLIALPGRLGTPAAGLLCGFGLGPLYPFALSVALPRFRATPVFVMAGVGASVVPWLTGALSSHLGSLRLGLLAPLLAFVLLAGSGFSMRAELR